MPRALLAAVSVALHAARRVASAVVPSTSEAYDNFVITTYETQNVTMSSFETVKFVKFITVESPGDAKEVQSMSITLPGRAFIEYVDYQDGGEFVNSSTLIQAKSSGDVFDLVNEVVAWSFDLTDFILNPAIGASVDTGHLLAEVSVFRANSILDINVESNQYGAGMKPARSLEAVLGPDVVYSRLDSSLERDSSNETVTIAAMETSNLYVQSASTPLDLSKPHVIAYDQSNIYFDGGALTANRDVSAITHAGTSITAFFDSIEPASTTLSTNDGGTICLVVSDSLDAGDDYIPKPAGVMLPGETDGLDVTGSFACSRLKIPAHEPRDISLATANFTPSGEAIVSPTEGNGSPGLRYGGVLTAAIASCVVGRAVF